MSKLKEIEEMLTKATAAPVDTTVKLSQPNYFKDPTLFDVDQFIEETANTMRELGVIHKYDSKLVSMLANNMALYLKLQYEIKALGNNLLGVRGNINPLLNQNQTLGATIEKTMEKLYLTPAQRIKVETSEKAPANRPPKNKQANTMSAPF